MTYDIGNPGLEDKPNTYIEDCMRTCSDKYFGEYVGREHLRDALKDAILSLTILDRIKKALFYGKKQLYNTSNSGRRVYNCTGVLRDISCGIAKEKGIWEHTASQQIIHGILGCATEAGEMLEALYAAVFEGKDLDLVNLREERGDLKWYLAILAHAQGDDWSADEKLNIAKLRKRFPEKFEQDKAINRNLDVERQTLEGNLPLERLAD